MDAAFRAPRGVGGELTPPPDKSITHRALMLAALGSGAQEPSDAVEWVWRSII